MDELKSYFSGLSAEGKREFARNCGVEVQYIRKILSPSGRAEGKRISESLALKFEHFSGGKVTRDDVLPGVDWTYLRGKRYRPRGSTRSGVHG